MSKEVLDQAVEACFQKAETRFGRRFQRPRVTLDLRGRAAGQAHMGKGQLRFNRALYQGNQAAFLTEVVPHEVAHWLAWQLHGPKIQPHGPEWQQLMQNLFLLAPKRTHDFAVAEQTFPYHCRCRDHGLSIRRHNKVARGESRYLCRSCGEALSPGAFQLEDG
ncbi:SprT family zinc-dependent metalloprotease [Gallaecimonas xiamenensis]|uniref:SprT protein n=1 Tax=Gallaecimonas xiamenensis 3-C-1 TaxID=745411 RepID=K2JRH5_9GAMM|nr:SprT family zinc-dependent metalloprotease [Gallaecimonas xiamenensis]EKE67765.1 SprT protein [Gallaecimonas xiamenensis 3-C-1]